MAKKYVRILNWNDYPHVKGYHYTDMCKRTYCHCGFVAVGEILDECPICGNKEFIGPYKFTETYRIDRDYIFRERHYVRIDKNNMEETVFKTVSQSDNSAIVNCSYELDKIADEINLRSHKVYGLGMEMFDYLVEHGYFVHSDYSYSKISLFRSLMTLCRDLYNAKSGCHNMEYFDELVTAMNGGDIEAKINYIAGRFASRPKQLLQDLYDIPSGLLPFMKNQPTFYRLLNNPQCFTGIDEEICNMVAAYYGGEYISSPLDLLDLIYAEQWDGLKRYLFTKAFKELYANPGYKFSNFKEVLEWINSGKHFENIKDFYLQKNRERFTAGLNAKKYDSAMENVYTNPADSIIAISKIK